MTTYEMGDNRHELLRDAIEEAIRSAIRDQDAHQVCENHGRYTYTEVSWVLAHIIHDLLRFGPEEVEMTKWADVEQFIEKLRLTGTWYDHGGKPPWLGRAFDPIMDNRSISWFCDDK